MTNFDHALNLATDLARYMFPDISDNRAKGGLDKDSPAGMKAFILRKLQSDKLDRLRGHGLPKPGCTRAEVVSYGGNVLKTGDVGNCAEIACAAAYMCERRYGVKDWNLIYYPEDADHIFLSIGDTGSCPKDFSDWPDDCAIFDGWAQIACMAPHYGLKWAAKMNEWTRSRDKVDLPKPTGTGFGDATAWRPVVGLDKAIYNG